MTTQHPTVPAGSTTQWRDGKRYLWLIGLVVPSLAFIGAGPSGLATARAFAEAGIPFDVLERNADVGGIWDMSNARTPMYESAHFISSRTQSAFDGFPMPESYPDYPGWRHILEYIRAFVDHYRLRPFIQFDTTVERVRRDSA